MVLMGRKIDFLGTFQFCYVLGSFSTRDFKVLGRHCNSLAVWVMYFQQGSDLRIIY